jgi:hypothetical protein
VGSQSSVTGRPTLFLFLWRTDDPPPSHEVLQPLPQASSSEVLLKRPDLSEAFNQYTLLKKFTG